MNDADPGNDPATRIAATAVAPPSAAGDSTDRATGKATGKAAGAGPGGVVAGTTNAFPGDATGDPTGQERIFVGLGANLGDAAGSVRAALRALGQLPGTRCVAQSSIWRSAPVDAGGPDFANAVAELRSRLSPDALLDALLAIETARGRERPYRNAPRCLDLDLLAYGQRLVDTPRLTLPHPRLHQRAFVLAPLAEIAPDWPHPRLGSLLPWRERARDQVLCRWEEGEGAPPDGVAAPGR
jgi:2-amino-4-hydroxy-6-hydroxymethyldihydropteridine diphosphokinase